ncbi:uncharacterized protein LOC123557574 isoform X2 [Mercenaria mercenaria]|nr:uncharacterized protein LOC123557574 isoform X2 [Mercenaria mercenaria]
MASGQANTLKRVYTYRLQALLIDGGTEVIRSVFDQLTGVPLTVHLSNSHTIISQLKTARIITQAQYAKLFQTPGNPTSASSSDLDMTLLVCLLQSTCGLKKRKDPIWFTQPAQNDMSVEADIVRMRYFRNELSHRESVAVSQQYFKAKWSEIETVLLRLNGNCQTGNPNLQTQLNDFKTGTVDEESQERYDQELKDWEEMEKVVMAELGEINQMLQDESCRSRTIAKEVTEIRVNVQGIQQTFSPRVESLKAVSEHHFNQTKENQDLFVRTATYKKAWERFKPGITILSGYSGEGKTTVASQMLIEACPSEKIIKLSTPQDWEQLNIKHWKGVFIDDIFGSDAFDEYKANHWKHHLNDLESAAHSLQLYVVITTRQNILNEANDRHNLNLFKEENVTILNSSDISEDEKTHILRLRLEKNKREYSDASLNLCISGWNSNECKIGFPECAVMFATNDTLFTKGPQFFAAPFEFFRKCIAELSQNENEYMILILIWTKPSRKLSKFDLEKTNITSLSDVAAELGYPLHEKSRTLRKTLKHHKDGLLSLTDRKDEYTFSHNVIGDVVGLEIGKEYPNLAIKYGSKSFVMRYVKTSTTATTDCIIVDDRRYSVLSKKLNHLLFEKNESFAVLDVTLKEFRINSKGIENTRISQSIPDISVLEHEAFGNATFVQEYIDPANENDIVNTPILEVYEHFRNPYCIQFEYGELGMCIPTFLLAKKNEQMITECIEHDMLTDREKYIALLFATRDNNEAMVRQLIEADVGVNEDALQIATVNENIKILKLLLLHFRQRKATKSHIQKRNSPLITATKRHSLDTVTCLLQSGVDINYANEDGLSAIDKAVICKCVDICEALTEKGCNLDAKSGKFKRTPLHKAVDMGCLDIVKLLLNVGASVYTTDHRGKYPIHTAAICGHTEILRLLLKEDKTLAVRPFNTVLRGNKIKNLTLYHYAVWKEDEILLKVLKEFEIDPNIQDICGRTPLYLATYYNKPTFVELLVDIADVNIPERNGYTPLHAASSNLNPKIVRLLCCSNVNIRMIDRKGNTVFHVLGNVNENAIGGDENFEDPLARIMVSECVKILLEKDPEFEYELNRMPNKDGLIVSAKCERDTYSLVCK